MSILGWIASAVVWIYGKAAAKFASPLMGIVAVAGVLILFLAALKFAGETLKHLLLFLLALGAIGIILWLVL